LNYTRNLKGFTFFALLAFLILPVFELEGSSLPLYSIPVTSSENIGSELINWSRDIYHIVTIVLLIVTTIFLLYFISLRRKNIYQLKASILEGPLSDSRLLQTLIDSLPDFVYIKDDQNKFILANKKLAQIVGKKNASELLGKSDFDFYPKEFAKEYLKEEKEIMLRDIPELNQKVKGLPEKGKVTWVSISKIPLHDDNGKVIGLVGIGRDITEIVIKETEIADSNATLTEINTLLEERQEEVLQQQEELKVTTEKFYEDKKQLRTLIDNMPDRIYIKDRNSRFIAGNNHVAKIMSVDSPDMLIGKTDYDFYDKDLADEYYRDEQELMASGSSIINKEERGLDLDGHEIIVSTTKVPYRNDKGEVIGVVGMGRDITPQKRTEQTLIQQQENLLEANTLLEEKQEEIQQQSEELHAQTEYLMQINKELEKLSLVASNTDNVIIIMDAFGNIEYRNRGFEKQYGLNNEQINIERVVNLREISSNKDIDNVLEEIFKTKKSISYESKTKDREGQEAWFQTTISPVLDKDNEIVKLIAIDSDITMLKIAEGEINLQKKEIEKNRDELKTLNATKDKFFSIIAHDLKNPFHSIMGFSELLTRNYDSIEESKKKEFLQLIKDSSSSAYNLLENLLNWSRTQTNNIQFSPSNTNISQILFENIQMLGVIAQNKEIELAFDIPEKLMSFADANMVNTILRNLLTNALKFTPIGGKITVNASSGKDQINISINDSGIGMDQTAKDKLFKIDEFHNTSGTSGETGTGLGLIICNEFIAKHGGKISVESELGVGSTFSFSLPLAKPEVV
jgi:PAS domain S-box-containing protein